ncbi:hypothetical protein MIR68_003469 [Amoeboaphelidium protococcarum]|nr:hypothetical protein MIR68_003469 [Amoeboaphelidium protococcarum]
MTKSIIKQQLKQLEKDSLKLNADEFSGMDGYTLSVLPSKKLQQRHIQWIQSLLTRNMKPIYEKTNDGWNLEDKTAEALDKSSRYLILSRQQNDGQDQEELIAFLHYRFVLEDTAATEDDNVKQLVIYCYELQVEACCVRRGLGSFLMNILHQIGSKYQVCKSMLTVFKINEQALLLYRKLGYEIDDICPSNYESADGSPQDYFIFSKNLLMEI